MQTPKAEDRVCWWERAALRLPAAARCGTLSARVRALLLVLSVVATASISSAEDGEPLEFDPDIAGASVEQLVDLTVTSVSMVPEKSMRAAAAVSVLTSEDIRRSGARSIPEVLRLVPGVQVARLDANKWSVSIRGFNDRTANKLLVMIDGRSIFNPLLSGTLWETKDVFLEDVERIEVIRGPGGSTWGTNAVNGVINIITKKSQHTQGGLVVAGAGTEERGFTDVRYGAMLSENTSMRAYGKYYKRDDGFTPTGAEDDSYRGNGDFRLDHQNENDSFMLHGLYDEGELNGFGALLDEESRDAVLQGQWQRKLSDTSSISANGYYARTDIDAPLVGEKRGTGELNLRYTFEPVQGIQLTQGVQYRLTSDKVRNTQFVSLDPQQRTDALLGASMQGRATLIPNELELTVGARVDHNDYSDYEFQPDFGLSWSPTDSQNIWASVSRAVRIPSRLENDFNFIDDASNTRFRGNRSLNSEDLLAYEVGYRRNISERILLDISTFYNVYNDLIVAQDNTLANSAAGHVYGIEIAPVWQPSQHWRLTGGYSLLLQDLRIKSGGTALPQVVQNIEGQNPNHQTFTRISYNYGHSWQFDFGLRYTDSLSTPNVSSYLVGDARAAWRPLEKLELAIIGQNLFEAHHFEQGRTGATEVQQGVYGQITWTY